jgi:heme exporter protein CcmD
MTLASHGDFIFAAYGAAAIVLGAIILWVMIDYRALKRTLAGFEGEGVTRRSHPARSQL